MYYEKLVHEVKEAKKSHDFLSVNQAPRKSVGVILKVRSLKVQDLGNLTMWVSSV